MSDGRIVYDVDVNDDGIEGKVKQTNDKIGSAAKTGSSAFGEVWIGALRAVGSKMVELGQQAISTAVDVAKESLAQVASFEQNVGGIQKLFGDSAGDVMENAKQAFATAGMSANEYMENVTGFSASLINSLGGDTAEAAKLADVAIRSMSDNANTYGTDMQSVMNTYQGIAKENYSMLDNLKLGFAGTKNGMKDLIATAATYKDEQAELGLTVDATSMDFANCVKAIEVMQKHMNIAGTTSAEASGTIEGSVNSMKAAWENFLTGTLDGEKFAGVALNAASNVVNAFKDIIPRLAQGFGEMAPVLFDKGKEIVLNLVEKIGEHKIEMIQKGTELIRNLGEGLVNGIPEFLSHALPMIMDFTASLRENAGHFIDAGIDFILNLMQGLMNSLPTLIEYIPTIISNVVNIINDNMPKILAMGVKLIVMLAEGIIKAVPALIENFPKIINMIIDIWKAIDWLNLGKFLINGIANGVKALITSIPSLLKNIGNMAVNGFKSINWWDLGSNIISGILNGLRNGVGMIIDAARDVARRALDAAKSFLGIHSPSREFAKVGKYTDEGFAEGIDDNAKKVEQASENVANKVLDASINVDYSLPNLDDANKDMSASLTSRLSSTVQRIIEVPWTIDSREIARATAWDMGEQLAWEMR
jgi:phage-related protein